MKKASIKFNQVYCINKHCIKKEYCYNVIIISNSGKEYTSYDNWTSYAINSKEAKHDILCRIGQTQAIDYILDDLVIKDNGNIPYFVEVKKQNNINPLFNNILTSIKNF